MTDKFCHAAKPADYFDTIARGLCFRVTAGGSKAFFFVYGPAAKRVWLRLGPYPDLGLAKARQKARDARGAVLEGKDPAAQKRARAASQTVGDLVESYIARHAAGKRSAAEIARRMRKNVAGVIGDIKLAELHRRDFTKCIDRVKDRGAGVEANRCFEDIRCMVRWARGRGDLDTNLVEGMKAPTEITARDRVLSDDEIRIMWAGLANAKMRESTRRVLRLCLVTGQRIGEVSGMTRDEFDLEKAIWTIPAARAKNKREHAVPLSTMALEIIAQQGKAPWIFPGRGGRAAITGEAVAQAVLRHNWGISPWTPHDLRRTAATGMEAAGVSPFVIGHVLNHVSATKGTVTSRIYARYTYEKEKREALATWAGKLDRILTGGANVVPLRAAG